MPDETTVDETETKEKPSLVDSALSAIGLGGDDDPDEPEIEVEADAELAEESYADGARKKHKACAGANHQSKEARKRAANAGPAGPAEVE